MLRWRKNKTKRSSTREREATCSPIFERVRFATMTSECRILALCDAVEYLCQASIPGAFVECGVWRGGSMMAAAICLLQNQDHRDLWLFDTFQGMSEPTPHDVDYLGNGARALLDQADQDTADSIWCYSELGEVKSNMASTGYPDDLVNYVQGPVENTLLDNPLPNQIALLRLDTDWYESTKIELEQLFPRLAPGGVLIIDDYGHWKGCRKAVDQYFAENEISILLNRIDYTGRIGIKLVNGQSRENTVAA